MQRWVQNAYPDSSPMVVDRIAPTGAHASYLQDIPEGQATGEARDPIISVRRNGEIQHKLIEDPRLYNLLNTSSVDLLQEHSLERLV